MNRLRGNYAPIEEDRLKGVLDNYQRLYRSVGWDRFAAGVDSVIFDSELLFFPSVQEFKKYLPESNFREKQEETRREWERDMRAKRAQHPEQFFGEADVIVMMRMVEKAVAGKHPRPSEQEIDAAISDARTKFGRPKAIISEREFSHFEN
jgi:hypothetical protein